MPEDPLRNLPRLGAEAMAPCAICRRQLLETDLPLFYRMEVKRCGIDAKEIQRHVGLANSMGGGQAGLVLADVLGPGVKPIVVMEAPAAFNVCTRCAQKTTVELATMVEVETGRGKAG